MTKPAGFFAHLLVLTFIHEGRTAANQIGDQARADPGPAEAPGGRARSNESLRVIVLDVDPCLAAFAEDTRRIAALELGRAVSASAPSSLRSAPLRVRAACEGATVVLSDGSGEDRHLSLNAADERVRARVLALAVAALVEGALADDVRARKAQRDLAATPSVAPAPTPTVVSARPDTPAPIGTGASLAAGASARAMASGTFAAGGRLSWSMPVSKRLVARVAGLAETATRDLAPGPVRMTSFALEGLLGLRFTRGRAGFVVAAGAAIGHATARGEPDRPTEVDGGDLSGLWAGPLARVEGSYLFSDHWFVALGIDAGTLVATIDPRVDGRGMNVWGGVTAVMGAEAGWRW